MAKWVKLDPNRESTAEFKELTRDQMRAAGPMMIKTGTLECVYSDRAVKFLPVVVTIMGFLVMVDCCFR